MFNTVQEEKDNYDKDVNSIGLHFWTRYNFMFLNRTPEQVSKKWSNLKQDYKNWADEIFKYPSGGIEPREYFNKFPNAKERLFIYEWMETLMDKVSAVTPAKIFDTNISKKKED